MLWCGGSLSYYCTAVVTYTYRSDSGTVRRGVKYRVPWYTDIDTRNTTHGRVVDFCCQQPRLRPLHLDEGGGILADIW